MKVKWKVEVPEFCLHSPMLVILVSGECDDGGVVEHCLHIGPGDTPNPPTRITVAVKHPGLPPTP